jgi:arylsulfatase A-like enzyme
MRLNIGIGFALLVAALNVLVTFVSIAYAAEAAARPNFVFIYADDWRWDCMGVVQRDQGDRARFPWLETPRLDRLAEKSIRFRNAFVVNSLCSPGRACVLTGQYSHANGIIGNSQPMNVNAPTLATRLSDAGYNTGYCGKFHMDGQRVRPGFQYVASFVGQGRYNDCPILLNGEKTETDGWIDDVSTDYAIEFLDQQNANKPYFLFLGFKSPHGPRGGENLPERVRDLYASDVSRSVPNVGVKAIFQGEVAPGAANGVKRSERAAEGHRAYMRHITVIDGCVGRVIDALERTGQANNTYIIVTSDNGYYLGEHNLSDKRSAYEESIRVPLLVHVPGEDGSRGVRDEMVLNIDHAETILELAGAKPLPETHGRSMKPLLSNDAAAPWRDAFLYEYFKEGQYTSPTVLAVRTPTHKLIKYPGHDEWTEIFDLQNDPYEMKNLADDIELFDELQKAFDEQSEAAAFRMPENVGKVKERPDRRERRNRQRAKRERKAVPQSRANP